MQRAKSKSPLFANDERETHKMNEINHRHTARQHKSTSPRPARPHDAPSPFTPLPPKGATRRVCVLVRSDRRRVSDPLEVADADDHQQHELAVRVAEQPGP